MAEVNELGVKVGIVKTPKLKNKFNKDRGYVCGGVGDRGCGRDVGLGIVVRGIVYCQKCYGKIKGEEKC